MERKLFRLSPLPSSSFFRLITRRHKLETTIPALQNDLETLKAAVRTGSNVEETKKNKNRHAGSGPACGKERSDILYLTVTSSVGEEERKKNYICPRENAIIFFSDFQIVIVLSGGEVGNLVQ